MKVLLVRPNINWSGKIVGPDIGLAYLGKQLLKENIKVKVLDCMQKEIYEPQEVFKIIKNYSPEVVGFKVFTFDVPFIKKISRLIKKEMPRTLIVAGGPYPSGDTENVLKILPDVDFAFSGEADIGLPQLVKVLKNSKFKTKNLKFNNIPSLILRENGNININPQKFIENLDELGAPDWELVPPPKYKNFARAWGAGGTYTPIFFTRGCPYNCTFCSVKLINGKGYRKRSTQNILEELKLLYEKFDVRNMSLADDNFTLNKKYVVEVCEALIKSKYKFKWDFPNGVRLDTLDEEIINLFEKAGWVSICVAIESGSQRILNYMQKKTSLKIMQKKINLIKKTTNMEIFAFFIMGYPQENFSDLRKSLNYALNLPLDLATFFYFTPHPGTTIFKQLQKKYPQKFSAPNWDTFHYDKPTFSPAKINEKLFRYFVKYAYLRFYLRSKIILGIFKRRKTQGLKTSSILKRIFKKITYTLGYR